MFPKYEFMGQLHMGNLSNSQAILGVWRWVPRFYIFLQKVGCAANLENHEVSFTFVKQWFNEVDKHEKEPKDK